MGTKELADMQITVTDPLGERAVFRAESFRFKVGNHAERITQNISTHNQISIEGRSVIDASSMGSMKSEEISGNLDFEKWIELSFVYLPDASFYAALDKVVTPNTIHELLLSEETKDGIQNESRHDYKINDDRKFKAFSSGESIGILCINSSGEFSFPNIETVYWYT